VPSLLFRPDPHRERVTERTAFFCPECTEPRAYSRVVVQRTLVLFSLPLLRFGRYGEYVECVRCLATYRPEVLAYDAGDATHRIIAEYQVVMRRVLALIVVTDGRILEPEIQSVQRVFEAVSGHRLGRAEILQEAEAVTKQPITVARYLARVMGVLNEYGKEQILRATAMISSSDGVIHDAERMMVVRLAGVMRVPPERVGAVLAEFE